MPKLALTVKFDESLCTLPIGTYFRLYRKVGFTLAETLITLTIIGVIAAMTIPTVVAKYTNYTYVVGLKKAYSTLQSALRSMPITEGCSISDYECIFPRDPQAPEKGGQVETEILARQLKVVKNEIGQTGELCGVFAGGWKSCIQTDDGMIFSASQGYVIVDINGLKGPNKNGYDIFRFRMQALNPYRTDSDAKYLSQVIPSGSKVEAQLYNGKYWKDSDGCSGRSISSLGLYCAGRVLEQNKIDY